MSNFLGSYSRNLLSTWQFWWQWFCYSRSWRCVWAVATTRTLSEYSGNSIEFNVHPFLHSLHRSPLLFSSQHDAFYTQRNLSMRNFVLSVTKRITVNYISSPEVGFLKSISSRINPHKTKLILRALGPDTIEVTTNQTYASLLRNLTFIKTFASGIIVPKTYIRPIDGDGYLQPETSLVSDAHKAELEVFASEFYNDLPLSYNYSYDPITEYLSYFDNGRFSVDGVLTDFPISPSAAIGKSSHFSSYIWSPFGPSLPNLWYFKIQPLDVSKCTNHHFTTNKPWSSSIVIIRGVKKIWWPKNSDPLDPNLMNLFGVKFK